MSADRAREFLDSNILVYAYDSSAGEKHARAVGSFWDALIIQSAYELGCRVIWSEDFAAGRRYDGVEMRNPFLP